MEEEQRCQEGHLLCANNCGFFGSPATMNLCSKCYRDLRLKEEQASSAKIAVEKSLLPSTSNPIPLPSPPKPSATAIETLPALADEPSPPPLPQPQAGRCTACRKRLGLTGFRCRCGLSFCGNHHHPEKHGCSFDYKGSGREAIKRANPVIKAAKLDKI